MEPLQHYLFIDIETVACERDFAQLGEGMQHLWQDKARKKGYIKDEDVNWAQVFRDKAAVFAEFGKIVCIGIGCFLQREGAWTFAVKSITGNDEKLLLNRFCTALTTFSKRIPKLIFCGHNIKEFDLPYISRRMVIHSMSLPDCLKLHGKKPWEVPHVDTMELWAFGDRKNYTSLALLAEVLGIPTPKDDISGPEVGRVYWEEDDLPRIGTYCEKDVITTARVFQRLMCYDEVAFETEHVPA